MIINHRADSAKNSKDSNPEPIYLDELVPYAKRANARVRVFFDDDQIQYRYGRDGFISLNGKNFNVRFDTNPNGPYFLKPDDIIGIERKNIIGYEERRVILAYKKK